MKRALAKPWLISESEKEQQQQIAVQMDFIRIEIELADTLCKMALEMHTQERARHLRFDAHRAMDAALHALATVRINKKDRDVILTRLEEVKAVLDAVDGNSPPASC